MATLRIGARTPKGIYKVIVLDVGRQVKIGLGYVDGKPIEQSYFNTLEDLETTVIQGREPNQQLMKRLGRLPTKIQKKLKDQGLIVEQQGGPTLAEVVKQFLDDKLKATDPRTVRNYRSTLEKGLLTYLDRNRRIEAIDANELLSFIDKSSERYADSTVANQIKRAKSVFRYALDSGYVEANPFSERLVRELASTFQIKLRPEREQSQIDNMTEEAVQQLLTCKKSERSELEDKEWNVYIHLLRFGGGRTSSYLVLRWSDIDFEERTIRLRMKRTGKKTKFVKGEKRIGFPPLLDEMVGPLLELRALQPEGTEYVLNKIGNLQNKPEFEQTNAKGERTQQGRWETNLSTTLAKILKRNGIERWEQIQHGFRAYCSADLGRRGASETELDAWIGNSPEVRKRYYGKFSKASRERVAELSRIPCEK